VTDRDGHVWITAWAVGVDVAVTITITITIAPEIVEWVLVRVSRLVVAVAGITHVVGARAFARSGAQQEGDREAESKV
jgi:hypothetical protein